MSFRSRVINIGSLSLGGDLPVRVQSMTNTDTLDTASSVAQCIRIIKAGGELVRLTAQGVREAENLQNIKRGLREAGFDTPLCADIHFNPSAAEVAAALVEKVRINPGNYADKRASFIRQELSEQEYASGLERIRDRLLPLIRICKDHGTVVRVGVNHGSLSDRIMTRYGNTPEGMAVSAVEFLKIFRHEGFNDLVVSLKSSDTRVMVKSNRRLVRLMIQEGMDYPVHLGITEAGEGDDGRIISAAGIGALLAEGIGDTVRVSLSEAPEREIPVAREIIRFIGGDAGRIIKPCAAPVVPEQRGRYMPEVLTEENGIFRDEKGNVSAKKVHTFNAEEICFDLPADNGSVILNPVFDDDDPVRLRTDAAALTGRYFIARSAQGLCISNRGKVQGTVLRDLSFAILQATEARITRTRYISCPTCGRTKFNLEEAVRKVKTATSHLTGMKIAVMGCIVNGPGEMAGSDYGYVGAGEGKVHIYRGTEAVLKNVPEAEALSRLLELIEKDQTSR
ncbi:MAG TPA: (E)-4-hydroxy-3-methylbut-2-enyl-diphosphate synthase [Bacteroidales bacterium]|nr:(E)-4-hydroxy-3-methylbut-2-enyl-diphosphate synthase [Bacteroidales bacterium]